MLLLGLSLCAQAKSLAITFDDLPLNRDIEVKQISKRTDQLLQTLNRYQVSTIGFVNEKHLVGPDKKKWQQILAHHIWLLNANTINSGYLAELLDIANEPDPGPSMSDMLWEAERKKSEYPMGRGFKMKMSTTEDWLKKNKRVSE